MLAAKIFGSLGKAGEGKTGFMGSLLGFFAGAKDAGDRSPLARLHWSASAGRSWWQGRRPWSWAQTASMLRPRDRGDTKIRLISITDSQNFNDSGQRSRRADAYRVRRAEPGFFRQLVAS